MDDLSGRVVIVPHADTDAGAELARVMCEAGASAVLVGAGFTQLGAVAAKIHGDTGAPIVIFAGDIRRDEERAVLAEMVSELFPRSS
jgi:NAD(P)-dependent dehydrogenase (short-subunit alcohol dehydrogenase family)